ncbi:MAG: dienelactone hydrolase family protein [Acidimicrobiales bacterium]|nr:dienelactone hydrolase family protein [Acidimicrobiales bacterium]
MPAQTIELPTPDGRLPVYEATPDGHARGAVVVVQEAFGVNDHIEDVTRRVAEAGYHGVAPALFHRAGGGTAAYGDMPAVLELFAGLDDAAVLVDLDATLAHLRSAGWDDRRIGVVGFCIGGRFAFLAAVRRALGAAVGFYGGGIVGRGLPGFPPLIGEAGALRTPFLGLFGDLDTQIPTADVEALRAASAAAAVPTEIVRYPAAGHGFHCDARASYEPRSAADAWARTLAWFERFLGPAGPVG